MRNDIHGNHKHLATVVLFLKYKCATSYCNTYGDDHPHDKTNTLSMSYIVQIFGYLRSIYQVFVCYFQPHHSTVGDNNIWTARSISTKRNLNLEPRISVSLTQELVQSTMANGHHTDMCTKKPTYRRHNRSVSQATAGTANSPDDTGSPDLQTNVSHQEQVGPAAIMDTAV